MFEYLMPMLVLRSHAATLLECVRAVVDARSSMVAARVPWGISESAFGVVDQHGTYQYKAFGVPGLGLKRGLAEDLVIAPYATALAAMVDPAAAAANFRRLLREGVSRPFGCYEALDFTPRKSPADEEDSPSAPARLRVVRAYFAHHQGMSLIALSNVVLGSPMVRRFHSDPRVQATEPLLQERVPRFVPVTGPAPPITCRAAVAGGVAASPHATRRIRSPVSRTGNTRRWSGARGGAGRGVQSSRQREDPVSDPGPFIYLRDVRSGRLWSATYQPVSRA
jgi:cyclic beta-1,2-glucan synthetase